jgi:integrase
MYSKKSSNNKTSSVSKASKNSVGVQVVKGRIRLSLPREISRAAYGIEQKFITPGLEATEVNLKLMGAKAEQISIDIATGNFDVTWEKYQLGVTAANKLVAIDGGKKTEMGLWELWEKYLEYKRPNLRNTTFIRKYQGTYSNAIKQALKQTNGKPDEIRNWLAVNRCSEHVTGILSSIEKAYQYGIQHEYVTKNPYIGMADEIEIKPKQKNNKDDSYNEFEDIRAFSIDEMNAIIEYFENTPTVCHWANYVKFLFWTGCRPGEAAALRWKHISPDCKEIRFGLSYDSKLKLTNNTKTNVTTARFPCSQKLTDMLLKMKSKSVNPDAFVFSSRENKRINRDTFTQNWTGDIKHRKRGAIPELIKQGKIRQHLSPYNTRHTYITILVNAGYDPFVVASWVRNSPEVIWKHYYQAPEERKPYEF